MTLAVVFFCTTLIPALKAMPVVQTAAQSAFAHRPAFSHRNQGFSQSQSPQAQSSSQSTDQAAPATPSSPSSSTAKQSSAKQRTHLAHKKKVEDCPSAPQSSGSGATGSAATGSVPTTSGGTAPSASGSAANGAAAAGSGSTGSAATGSGAAGSDKPTAEAAKSGAPSTSVKCPPEKIVVPQGGTKEPSIQLVGGATGDAASRERNATDQNLGAAESNLKEIAGRPLNANQQELATKVRQFIDQSRSAVQAGELERAGTLALKAKELSDELVKPDSQ